jgi:hypothetical protein
VADVKFVHALQGAPSYQPRPELDQLREWWIDESAGVCALVGLGGTGKTALAERFLAHLQDGSLLEAGEVFVYSFYEQPIVEEFFAELGAWIEKRERRASHYEVLEALKRSEADRLLVLDGLERAQSDGTDNTELGELEETPLRDP